MRRAGWLCVALLLAAAPAQADYAAGMQAYHNGDLDKAKAEFEQAAETDGRAMVALGIMAARGDAMAKDMEVAAGWFERAAAAGEASGQYHFGRLLYGGVGVEADKARAAAMFEDAAAQDHVGAIQALSLMLETGDGVSVDIERAFALAKRNAEAGVPRDQLRLANMYAEGRGIEADILEAYFWSNLAAVSGMPEAQETFQAYAKKLTGEQREAIDRRAAKWRPKGEYKQ